MMNIQEQNFGKESICSTLRFEPLDSQVPLLVGWNDKKPSTEGNEATIEAASVSVPVPKVAAPMPGNIANVSAGVSGIAGLMNPSDPALQMLFDSFSQTMLQEFTEKLTEQITENR